MGLLCVVDPELAGDVGVVARYAGGQQGEQTRTRGRKRVPGGHGGGTMADHAVAPWPAVHGAGGDESGVAGYSTR